jgi:hypothetical protein
MKKSIDLYCRNTIKKSISPSLSIDNIDNKDLSDAENNDDFDFFNKKFEDTFKELFDSLDDIVFFSNFELKEKIEKYCRQKRIDFSKFENVKIIFLI